MADQPDDKPTPLNDCMETVQQLKEENQELREAADTFGELAERLNVALREEREAATELKSDAPATPPVTSDR